MKIGFIGLGIMGSRMAANLAIYECLAKNRDDRKADEQGERERSDNLLARFQYHNSGSQILKQ